LCELPIPRKEQEIKQALEFIRRDSSKNQKREKVLVLSVAGVSDITAALSLTGRARDHSGG
jgi:NH3-dependent NAD+ synthetase